MDSITHIAIGACLGEAIAGKVAGRRAMLWGAIAHSLPDVDVICTTWMNTTDSLLAHRSFTHSWLFALLLSPLMGFVVYRLHKSNAVSFNRWTLLFAVAIGLHIFLDAFNNYGVGWWEPFSHQRIAFNALYVVDPLFSIWPLLAAIALLVFSRSATRRLCWMAGLLISCLYLTLSLLNKAVVTSAVKDYLPQQEIRYNEVLSTPAPLQCWLWYIVVAGDSGVYTGYRSVLAGDAQVRLTYFPRNENLLHVVSNQQEVKQLKRFAQSWYTVEQWGDTTVFNDCRFGQINGWQNPAGKFAFHYFLKEGADNRLVVQRGRFADWDWLTIQNLLRRMKQD